MGIVQYPATLDTVTEAVPVVIKAPTAPVEASALYTSQFVTAVPYAVFAGKVTFTIR